MSRPTTFSLMVILLGLLTNISHGQSPRLDSYGDPLPNSILYRFGSVRFRTPGGIESAILSPDEKRLATCSNGTIYVFDLESGRRLFTFNDTGMSSYSGLNLANKLVFSLDGKRLYSPSTFDVRIRAWNLETGKEEFTLGTKPKRKENDRTYYGEEGSLFLMKNGTQLWSIDQNQLMIWDLANRKEVQPKKENSGINNQSLIVSMSEDRSRFVRVENPNQNNQLTTFTIFETDSQKELDRIDLPTNGNFGYRRSVVFSKDNTLLAIKDLENEVVVWDLKAKKQLYKFTAPEEKEADEFIKGYSVCCFSTDKKILYVGSMSGKIFRYDLATGKELTSFRPHVYWTTHVTVTKDNRTLISTGWDGSVKRWDISTGQFLPDGEGYMWLKSSQSPNGQWMAIGDFNGRLDLWSMKDRKLVKTLQKHGSPIRNLVFHPGGKELCTFTTNGHLHFWNLDKLVVTRKTKLPEEAASLFGSNCFRFTLDGKGLFYSSQRGAIQLWDIEKEKVIWAQNGDNSGIGAMDLSPDGSMIVTGNQQFGLVFRDAKSGTELRKASPIQEKTDENNWGFQLVYDTRFFPDGKRIGSSHYDGFIRIWDVQTGRQLSRFRGRGEYNKITFSNNGNWVFSNGMTDCSLWDVETGKELIHFKDIHSRWLPDNDFLRDGKTVLVNSNSCVDFVSIRPQKGEPKKTPQEIWNDFSGNDPIKHFNATWQVIDAPEESVAFFRAKIEPVKVRDPMRIANLIQELDHPRFAVREKATNELLGIGSSIEPALITALKGKVSQEQQSRIEKLRSFFQNSITPEDRRAIRILSAVELSGSNLANQVLNEWASGADGAYLTEQAKNALIRSRYR